MMRCIGIQWATGSLGESEMVTTDRTSGWKAVQGIGQGITVAGAWSVAASGPVGAGATAVGATVMLVGFLGENLDQGARTEQYAHGVEQVVGRLNDEIDETATWSSTRGVTDIAEQLPLDVLSKNIEIFRDLVLADTERRERVD